MKKRCKKRQIYHCYFFTVGANNQKADTQIAITLLLALDGRPFQMSGNTFGYCLFQNSCDVWRRKCRWWCQEADVKMMMVPGWWWCWCQDNDDADDDANAEDQMIMVPRGWCQDNVVKMMMVDGVRIQRWMLERCFRTLAMPMTIALAMTTAALRKFCRNDQNFLDLKIDSSMHDALISVFWAMIDIKGKNYSSRFGFCGMGEGFCTPSTRY